jgi:hypothetical protein
MCARTNENVTSFKRSTTASGATKNGKRRMREKPLDSLPQTSQALLGIS